MDPDTTNQVPQAQPMADQPLTGGVGQPAADPVAPVMPVDQPTVDVPVAEVPSAETPVAPDVPPATVPPIITGVDMGNTDGGTTPPPMPQV